MDHSQTRSVLMAVYCLGNEPLPVFQVASEQAFQSISVTAEKWLPLRGVIWAQNSWPGYIFSSVQKPSISFNIGLVIFNILQASGAESEAEGGTSETSKKWICFGGRRTDAHQRATRPVPNLEMTAFSKPWVIVPHMMWHNGF